MQHEKRIGHMLKRREQGLTLRELSDEFDLSPQHIGRLVKNITKNPLPNDYTQSDLDEGRKCH